jgi:hypothetical protein
MDKETANSKLKHIGQDHKSRDDFFLRFLYFFLGSIIFFSTQKVSSLRTYSILSSKLTFNSSSAEKLKSQV